MIDLKTLRRAIEQISEEKGIDAEKILEAIESSIAAAYKKDYEKKGEIIKTKFDLRTGEMKFWLVKTVVDETAVRFVTDEEEIAAAKVEKNTKQVEPSGGAIEVPLLPRYNTDRHLTLDEARKVKKDAMVGDEISFPLDAHEDFGRVAAQTAKQVILQKIREAERESILKEFRGKENEVISGVIQRFDRGAIFVDLKRATGIMYEQEGIPGEHYKTGDRLRFLITSIQEEGRSPGVLLSRADPRFVTKLFAVEVPEVTEGLVTIKAIAREAGQRTKIAVASSDANIDPVGSCVGQRGTRVMTISNELKQEKIDIIEWSEDPVTFIKHALSPAKVTEVQILPSRVARVLVPDNELSLAIGRGGQNVRLAARLTGWNIDVRSVEKPEDKQVEGAVEVAAVPIADEGIVDDGSEEAVGKS